MGQVHLLCLTNLQNLGYPFVIENVIETLKENAKKDATPEQCLKVIEFIEEVYKRRKVESII